MGEHAKHPSVESRMIRTLNIRERLCLRIRRSLPPWQELAGSTNFIAHLETSHLECPLSGQ